MELKAKDFKSNYDYFVIQDKDTSINDPANTIIIPRKAITSVEEYGDGTYVNFMNNKQVMIVTTSGQAAFYYWLFCLKDRKKETEE